MVVGKAPLITAGDLAGLLAQSPPSNADEFLPLAEIEKRHIRLALDKSGGNVSLAARLLQLDRATVYDKIRKYGLVSGIIDTD